jgi:hypothetical protein
MAIPEASAVYRQQVMDLFPKVLAEAEADYAKEVAEAKQAAEQGGDPA